MFSHKNDIPFNISRRGILAATVVTAAAATIATSESRADEAKVDVSKLLRVKQVLVAPPFLPEHEQVATSGPKIVEVSMAIEEKKIVIDKEGKVAKVFPQVTPKAHAKEVLDFVKAMK